MNNYLILGAGITGYSVIRYLYNVSHNIFLYDQIVDNTHQLLSQYPKLTLLDNLEHLPQDLQIIASPGIDLSKHEFTTLQGKKIYSDIDLFAKAVTKPIIAITGTNGKSTVTTLVSQLLINSGYKVGIGGNIGIPALNLLCQEYDIYVLEISSFHLDITTNLRPKVACILNISADHLDRHKTMENYIATKKKIYNHAEFKVCNANDINTITDNCSYAFAVDKPNSYKNQPFGIDGNYLQVNDVSIDITTIEFLQHQHNIANVLAAVTIAYQAGLNIYSIEQTLREFKPLRHRCEVIGSINQVTWYNDSKSTNIGSTKAAIASVANDKGKIILILGGRAKDTDYNLLLPIILENCRSVIVFGEARQMLYDLFQEKVNCIKCDTITSVINNANALAKSNDIVLFSPACASFDMFKNYAERGVKFTQLVKECIYAET